MQLHQLAPVSFTRRAGVGCAALLAFAALGCQTDSSGMPGAIDAVEMVLAQRPMDRALCWRKRGRHDRWSDLRDRRNTTASGGTKAVTVE